MYHNPIITLNYNIGINYFKGKGSSVHQIGWIGIHNYIILNGKGSYKWLWSTMGSGGYRILIRGLQMTKCEAEPLLNHYDEATAGKKLMYFTKKNKVRS